MRLPQLFHALVEKFVPMDEQTQLELSKGALDDYNRLKDEATYIKLQNEEILQLNTANAENPDYVLQPLKKLKLQHKVINLLESHWTRYVIAILFIYLVPKIKSYMNGDLDRNNDDDEEENEGDDFAAIMEYRKFKKSMR